MGNALKNWSGTDGWPETCNFMSDHPIVVTQS
jgi:hypothetical protein